ncbi:MAG: DUF4468 domain-containing protein [Prevotella sp.]|jgi:hypothetical protein|nr:DUF4468 domain-containing protein [Prevotella sp.]
MSKGKLNIFAFGLLSVLFAVILYGCGTMMGAAASEESRRFETIIDVPNLSKSDLYVKVNAWFVEKFNSAESVIEFQDKEAGKIMGKYVYTYSEGIYTYAVRQTISIDVRDNKLRFVVNDPYFKTTSGMGQAYPDAQYSILKTQTGIDKARVRWEELSNSLSSYLNDNSDTW